MLLPCSIWVLSKFSWTINPWAFCTICKLELHVVAIVLPSICHYTAASSMAPVRSRPRPRRRSPPWFARCAHRRLVLSTWSTTKRNQEMTVRGEANSRDPPGSWHYASRCLVITSQKKYFLLIVWQLGPVSYHHHTPIFTVLLSSFLLVISWSSRIKF